MTSPPTRTRCHGSSPPCPAHATGVDAIDSAVIRGRPPQTRRHARRATTVFFSTGPGDVATWLWHASAEHGRTVLDVEQHTPRIAASLATPTEASTDRTERAVQGLDGRASDWRTTEDGCRTAATWARSSTSAMHFWKNCDRPRRRPAICSGTGSTVSPRRRRRGGGRLGRPEGCLAARPTGSPVCQRVGHAERAATPLGCGAASAIRAIRRSRSPRCGCVHVDAEVYAEVSDLIAAIRPGVVAQGQQVLGVGRQLISSLADRRIPCGWTADVPVRW